MQQVQISHHPGWRSRECPNLTPGKAVEAALRAGQFLIGHLRVSPEQTDPQVKTAITGWIPTSSFGDGQIRHTPFHGEFLSVAEPSVPPVGRYLQCVFTTIAPGDRLYFSAIGSPRFRAGFKAAIL